MNRRNFFALVIVPFVARFLPKPKPIPPAGNIIKLIEERIARAISQMEYQFARDSMFLGEFRKTEAVEVSGGTYLRTPLIYPAKYVSVPIALGSREEKS